MRSAPIRRSSGEVIVSGQRLPRRRLEGRAHGLPPLGRDLVGDGLSQVVAERGGVLDVDLGEAPDGLRRDRLDDVRGFEHAARGRGQASVRPPAQPRQQPHEQRLERVVVTPAHALRGD